MKNKQDFKEVPDKDYRLIMFFTFLFVVMATFIVALLSGNKEYQIENNNLSAQLNQSKEQIAQMSNDLFLEQNNTEFFYERSIGFEQQLQDAKPKYQKIAEKVASEHNWTYNKYMCCNFAQELVNQLEGAGYTASVKQGYWFNLGNGDCSGSNFARFNCGHCWVEINNIEIESTTGHMIPIDIYKQDYSF
jgi:hypothetical protein